MGGTLSSAPNRYIFKCPLTFQDGLFFCVQEDCEGIFQRRTNAPFRLIGIR